MIGRAGKDQRVCGEGFGAHRQFARRPAHHRQVAFARLQQLHQGLAVGADDQAHVDAPDLSNALSLGTEVSLRAVVALGELSDSDVDVQVAYGRVDEHDDIVEPATASLRLVDKRDDGTWIYEGQMRLDRTGPFGYSVRVLPNDQLLSTPAEFTGVHTRIDALYLSMATVSTVGFGDASATGQLARAVITGQMAFNIAFVATLVGLFQSRLQTNRERRREH